MQDKSKVFSITMILAGQLSLFRSSVMEYRNPHLAVLAAAEDGFADCYAESFVVPQGVQDMKDALPGAFAEQRR